MPQRERPLCEGCGAQKPTFGTPTERKRRWCGGCGKAKGAISLAAKMGRWPESGALLLRQWRV